MKLQVLGYPSSLCSTVFFLSIFILAFFPSLFFSVVDQFSSLILNSNFPLQLAKKIEPFRGLREETGPMSSWFQKTITLPAKSRGSYLITDSILQALPELKNYRVGILHLFIQHTSCAITLNENWDSDVLADMSDALDRIVPEDKRGAGVYRHSAEGSDDMPAHVKTALIGNSVSIPISNGQLMTGTWQGVWYVEFRRAKHTRRIVATINGEKVSSV